MNLKKKICLLAIAIVATSTTANAISKSTELPVVENKVPQIEGDPFSNIVFDAETLKKQYKDITKEQRIMEALELMKGTLGDFSRTAILGNNLTDKRMKIEFKNLNEINPKYGGFDALGWKKSSRLYIYINNKHENAPAAALAALLSHEALHQDEYDSLNEETYAWTMEAAVWTQLTEKNPALMNNPSQLVKRENMLKQLFERGNYSNKYIKKAVFSNTGYNNLPSRSPGFEDEDL